MTFTFTQVLALAGRTVQNPREGASEVLSLGLPRDALWTAVALVVVLSILLSQFSALMMGASGAAPMAGIGISPVMGGLVQLGLLVGMAAAIHLVGRAMGGSGSFPEALLLMAWLQFIMICVQVVQLLAILVIPPLTGIIFILGLVLFLWLLTNFVAVLHGFRSLAQVFVMILVTAFAIAFFLSLVLTILGVTVPIEQGST